MFGSSNPSGKASNSPFGSSSVFGQNNNANHNPFAPKPFGSTSSFGAQTGGTSPAFGASSSPSFGSSMPAFGASSTPAFGASSSAFAGAQVTTPAFGSSGLPKSTFGGQHWGSRVTPYTQTPENHFSSGTQPAEILKSIPAMPAFTQTAGMLKSISAMPAYKEKSHEEIRLEDYQLSPILFSSATSTNPFAPKTSTPFGTSTPSHGSSPFCALASNPFGSTPSATPSVFRSTPGFGSTTSVSLLGSSPVFGTSSSPAFGSSMPAFGASSTPAFGASPSASGGSSVFEKKPAFGGFGSTTRSSPFGSSFQQSQPAFGSGVSGSSPFVGSSQPFGSPSTPAFGSSSNPAFGSSPTPAFGSSPTPAFGAISSPFSFGSTPAFGQSTSASGSSPFGTTNATSAFGAQSSSFGAQGTTPAFGQLSFGGQRGGSRVTAYAQTPDADFGSDTQSAGILESISAMPSYKEKSHEELRWEDYQLGDKGSGFGASNTPAFCSTAPAFGATTSTFSFWSTPSYGQSTSAFGSSPVGTNATSAFGTQTSPFGAQATTPVFRQSSSGGGRGRSGLLAFRAQTRNADDQLGDKGRPKASGAIRINPRSNPFSSSATSNPIGFTPGYGSTTFGTTQQQGATSSFATGINFGNTESTQPLFQLSTPSLGQTSSLVGQTAAAFKLLQIDITYTFHL